MNTIISFLCGDMKNLSYVVIDDTTKEAVIVDPTWGIEDLMAYIVENELEFKAIWLTHTHYDHIQGIDACLVLNESAPIYVHSIESSRVGDDSFVIQVNDGDAIKLGHTNWQVIHTPGHSPGGICFYSAPHLITGDTLFVNGCGRADITGANIDDLYRSLHRLKSYPGDTIIYPGHDYARRQNDVLSNQLESNRFLKASDYDTFVKLRMK